MGMELRILLVLSSIAMVSVVVLKIRKSKFQIHDGIFWFLLSVFFLIMSIFPQAVEWVADLIGVMSPANLVFLVVLALLIVKNFLLSIKISLLEYNIVKLTQRVVVEEVTSADVGESDVNPEEELKR